MKRAAILFLLLLVVPAWSVTSRVPWNHNIDQALQEAHKKQKPIFIDAFADWCEWCHKLDQDVYSDPRFVRYLEHFVPLRIDVEDNGAGAQFASEHEITDLPTLLVLDSNGQITNRIGGYMDAAALIEDIDKIEGLVEQERKNPSNPDVTYELATEYLAREMYGDAEQRFQRIVSFSNAKDWIKESATFSLALAQYYEQKYEMARSTLERYEAKYGNGSSDEDALLLLSEISLQLNSTDKARQYLQEFLRKYPNSGNVARAQQVLSTLNSHN